MLRTLVRRAARTTAAAGASPRCLATVDATTEPTRLATRRRGPVLARDAVGEDLAGLAAIDHPVAVEVRSVEGLTQLVLRERLQAQRAEELVAREVERFSLGGLSVVDRGEASTAAVESRRVGTSVDCGEASRRRARGRGGAQENAAPHESTQHDQFCCVSSKLL